MPVKESGKPRVIDVRTADCHGREVIVRKKSTPEGGKRLSLEMYIDDLRDLLVAEPKITVDRKGHPINVTFVYPS